MEWNSINVKSVMLSLVLFCSCAKEAKVSEYWVVQNSRLPAPSLKIVQRNVKEPVIIEGFDISLKALDSIISLTNKPEVIHYDEFIFSDFREEYVRKYGKENSDSLLVTRITIFADNERGVGCDLIYTKKFGVVFKKYHGPNYEYLSIVNKDGEFHYIDSIAYGIFYHFSDLRKMTNLYR